MERTTVSVAEGKKNFSRLLERARSKREKITITKRGYPIAVIVPYDEYKRSRRFDAYRKIMEARKKFSKAGIGAEEVFKESKKQLEKRS